jgi:hypothetical protein
VSAQREDLGAPATLWGVGQWIDELGERVAWEVGSDEINRAIGSAPARLAMLGVERGERVLFTSMLSEAAQFWPLVVGCMLAGAQLSCADATSGEALRVQMFTRLLSYRAAIGISGAVLDGLDDLDADYAAVFGEVPVIVARPEAYERLVGAGLTPHAMALVGPALAIASEPRGPLWVDEHEWRLDADADGMVLVTNLRPTATRFERTRTALRGEVIDGHGLFLAPPTHSGVMNLE